MTREAREHNVEEPTCEVRSYVVRERDFDEVLTVTSY